MSHEAWSAEIAEELAEAQAQLAGARADLAQAQIEQADARSANEVQRQTFAALRAPISSALTARLKDADRTAHALDGKVAQAGAMISVLVERVEDLLQAQRELGILAGEIEP